MFDDMKKEALGQLKQHLKDALAKKLAGHDEEKKGPDVVAISVEKKGDASDDTVGKPADAEADETPADEASESSDEQAKEDAEGDEAPLPDVYKKSLAILRALKPAAKKKG